MQSGVQTRSRKSQLKTRNDENAIIVSKQVAKTINTRSRSRVPLVPIDTNPISKRSTRTEKDCKRQKLCVGKNLFSAELRRFSSPVRSIAIQFFKQRCAIRVKCMAKNPSIFLELDKDFGHVHKIDNHIAECSFDYLQMKSILAFHLEQNFMKHCVGLNPRMRYILVDWMVQVHSSFRLLTDTLYLAIGLLDQFLQKACDIVTKNTFQLVGITTLYIAAKYEEMFPPDVHQFCNITEGAFCASQILDCEILILNKLDFDMVIPTPYLFLRRLLLALRANSLTQNMAKYFLEVGYQEYNIVHYGPNCLAAMAVCLARAVVTNQPILEKVWDDRISFISGLLIDDIREPLITMARGVYRQKEPSKYRSTYTKFGSNDAFQRVSTLPQMESKTMRLIAGEP
ncbi:unnamed protein product [Rodentolepis nana]|uniref:G2/mitotic-specific cyclin-B3 n=1 Tax=Rodentolepis nana TaxID=102285 RepID=A0A0R3TZI7_RODNA|nr:unnamed protein product [Rodentolepis nana]